MENWGQTQRQFCTLYTRRRYFMMTLVRTAKVNFSEFEHWLGQDQKGLDPKQWTIEPPYFYNRNPCMANKAASHKDQATYAPKMRAESTSTGPESHFVSEQETCGRPKDPDRKKTRIDCAKDIELSDRASYQQHGGNLGPLPPVHITTFADPKDQVIAANIRGSNTRTSTTPVDNSSTRITSVWKGTRFEKLILIGLQ